MQEETTVVAQLGGLSVTSYSLMMLLAAALGVAAVLIRGRKDPARALSLSLCGVLGGVLGGHLFYCLCYIDRLADYENGLKLFLRFDLGGYMLYGALLGGLIALFAWSRAAKRSFLDALDDMAPGAMLAVCVGRAAEMFSSEGLGAWVDGENAAMLRFPFSVPVDDYGFTEYYVPVFAYEALAALVLAVLAAVLLRRAKQSGRTAGIVLTLFNAAQIELEMLRRDNYLRYGFVRISQVIAILMMLAVLVIRLRAMRKNGAPVSRAVLRTALLVMCAVIVILVEFCLEKTWSMPWLRAGLVVFAALAAVTMLHEAKGFSAPAVVCTVLLLAVCAAAAAVFGQELDENVKNSLLMACMGVSLITAAADVLLGSSAGQTRC